ncbi:MAG: glycosyltransferase [Candidatus Latescibacteria bacterium]|nr:glycosyltransferase [bacterium]MBD3425149.1 glycosyltransferase [Candidatus Latescibacterota bacterium]
MKKDTDKSRVAVVLPCYKSKEQVFQVLQEIGEEADLIVCVDDGCPMGTGNYIERVCTDPRVRVIFHSENRGVGGAVITGYRYALEMGSQVIVKIDSDAQMDPKLIPLFIKPVLEGYADYTKGTRFTLQKNLDGMPKIRIFGNAVLSLFAKLSTGYWKNLDPTNGFTAIHASVLKHLPLDKIDRRFFFETDMLYQLRKADAKVLDIPMKADYGDEESNLKVGKSIIIFAMKHIRNTIRRIFYQYFIKDFGIATIQLVMGLILLIFGSVTGIIEWRESIITGNTASAGSVMLAALPVILGIQLLLSFLNYDISTLPEFPISRTITIPEQPSPNDRETRDEEKLDNQHKHSIRNR